MPFVTDGGNLCSPRVPRLPCDLAKARQLAPNGGRETGGGGASVEGQ
jgi:hypothetical protein